MCEINTTAALQKMFYVIKEHPIVHCDSRTVTPVKPYRILIEHFWELYCMVGMLFTHALFLAFGHASLLDLPCYFRT